MAFTENRLKHIYGVACLMQKLAPQLGLDSAQMFVLGWLHDIGYAFSTHEAHAAVGTHHPYEEPAIDIVPLLAEDCFKE